MPKVSELEKMEIEDIKVDKDYENKKAEVEVSLPCGKIRVIEGEKYTIKHCQIYCCLPEVALNPGLDIEVIWGDSWEYEVELLNLLDTPIYLTRTIDPKCTTTFPFADGDGTGDYLPTIFQANPESNIRTRFEIRLSQNGDSFTLHNVSDDYVLVSYPVMPNSKVRISERDQLSLKSGEKIFSYNITYDPNDWW